MNTIRGQVSIFFLMVVILTIAGFFVFYLGSGQSEKQNLENADFLPIKNFLDNCAKIESEKALLALGWQGGLTDFDEKRMIITHFGSITYSYFEGKNTLPTLDEMKEELVFGLHDGVREARQIPVEAKVSIEQGLLAIPLDRVDALPIRSGSFCKGRTQSAGRHLVACCQESPDDVSQHAIAKRRSHYRICPAGRSLFQNVQHRSVSRRIDRPVG